MEICPENSAGTNHAGICTSTSSNSMTERVESATSIVGWINESLYNETVYDCENFSQGSPLSAEWFQAILYVLYISIFVVALVGNAMVCYVVYKSRPGQKQNRQTDYYIVNLAVGDILIDLFCVPTSFISTLVLQYWPFWHELCRVVNFAQATSVLVSAYTLVAISMDRYGAIKNVLRPRGSTKIAKFSIFVVWLLAIIVAFPILIVSGVEQPSRKYQVCDRYVCTENWSSPQQRFSYTVALLILQYVLPLLILMFSYTSIAIMVWAKRPPGEAENNRDQRMTRSKRKKYRFNYKTRVKMTKMMVAVVIVFTICWLPFNVLNLVIDNNEGIRHWHGLPYVWAILHWLSMSHACYNPVIYCWMSTSFRKGFYKMLKWVPFVGRYIPDESHAYNTSVGGIPLAGFDGQNNSSLRRINTYTTYVSVRRKTNHNYGAPIRSASFRCNNSLRSSGPMHRHFIHLEVQPEESL